LYLESPEFFIDEINIIPDLFYLLSIFGMTTLVRIACHYAFIATLS